jgi:hypothetical protein
MDSFYNPASSSAMGAAVLLLALATGGIAVYFAVLLKRLTARYDALMTGAAGKSVEEMVVGRLRELNEVKKNMLSLNSRCNKLDEQIAKCVQKTGVVRFSAFDGTGSDLSFTIALLDEQDDGVVFSSIYGRSEGRCYAKPINGGRSDYPLSDEEKRAIEISKKGK